MYDLYSSQSFEEKYTYNGHDLGATWAHHKTVFRLWAPTATTVSVNLYRTGTPGAKDFLCQIHKGLPPVYTIILSYHSGKLYTASTGEH